MARIAEDVHAFIRVIGAICGQKFRGLRIVAKRYEADRYCHKSFARSAFVPLLFRDQPMRPSGPSSAVTDSGPLPEVSILIPAFNEEAGIEECLARVTSVMNERTEVLVIDGGHDGTAAKVRQIAALRPAVRYVSNHPDRGKGHAIRTGIREARGRWHAQFDADLQFDAADLPALLEPLRTGRADVVLGSRFLPASARDVEATWVRSLGNHVVSAWVSLLFGQRFTDVMAGIKAWSAEAATRMDLQSDDYSYELEIPARARRLGLRVVEVPVATRARAQGASKVSVVSAGLRALAAALRFRWARR